MALQSELPPLGETNNTFDGQKSDDETEEGEDLEEGEILDSGAEAEDDNKEDIKLFSLAEMVKNSPKKSPNKSPKLNAGEESAECTTESSPGSLNLKAENNYGRPERYFSKFRNMEYVDHDRMSDEDGNADCKKWFERSHSKKIRDGSERMDYRKELANHLDSDGSLDPCVKGEKKKKRKTRPKKLSIAKRKKILEKTKKRIKDGKMIHKPCKYYEEGHCHKGSDCPYQHIPKLTKKREICRYYLGGSCKKMKTCPFMHGEFPCKFYHTNTKCFSGDNCRFSHAPLTEDLRNLLHDYLKVYHGDDYHHDKPKKRERETTPIPEPPPKRICLLGSPPRHIKEAEETKRWREEMMHLQREQQIDAFQIHLESNEMPMPNINRRANFYKDSMSSPVKERPMHMNQDFEPRNRMSPNMGNHFNMPNDRFGRMPYENHMQNDSVDWKNIQALIDKKEAPENNFGPIQNHQSIVIKSEPPPAPIDHFYPTSTFSNDMRIKNEPVPEDSELLDEEDEDFRPLRINQDAYDEESMSPRRSADEASPPHVQVEEHPDPDPIVIPNHLPRKQRELMLRIQKHQKLKSTAENEEFQASEDKTESDAEVTQEVEEIAEVKDEMKETLDSSDDDDDDPLTIVLQKLNQTPPPKPKEVLPPQTEKLAPNLNQMLSSIMQKVNENRSGSVYQEQTNNFWTNILSGTVPPVKSDSTSSMAQTNPTNIMADEGNAVRRGLLPCPQMPPLEKPKADVRDPRLKNRDPRMAAAAAAAANTPSSVLKPEIPNMRPLSILPHDVSIGRHQVNPHHKDLNSLIPNQTPAAVVEGLKGTIPYKLRAVSVPPLNYSSYVQASHSDPKLLNDPRLRKLLVPLNATQTPTQVSMEKFSVPKPTSILPDLPLFANIVIETNPAPTVESPPIEKPTLPEIQLPQLQPPQLPKVSDPRTRRSIERRLSGNNTPPHLPVAEPHVPLPLAPTLTHMPLPLAPTLTHMPLPLAPPTLTHMPLPLAPPTLTHMPLPLAPPTLTHMPLPLAPPTLTHMPLPLAPPTLTHMPLPLAPPITHMPLPLAPPITHIPLPLAPTFTKSSVIPTPASHLPRSMADPRMARLQDPRRTRTLSDSVNKNLIRQPPELKKPTPPIIDITEEVIDITQPTPPTEPDKEGSTSSEVIVVKPPEEKTKRNKAVHRNRKTSMDYASPLNSCNDSRASENLNFNNYNKRPKRPAVNTPLRDAPASDVMPVLAPIVMGSPIIPEFSTSDNSNLDSDSMDSNLAASLKDVFKTRDPTASPFC